MPGTKHITQANGINKDLLWILADTFEIWNVPELDISWSNISLQKIYIKAFIFPCLKEAKHLLSA